MRRNRRPDGSPITYADLTVDARNPFARFSHRRRIALATGVAADLVPPGGTIVDYGCGPGVFLADVGKVRADIQLFGYDPYAVLSPQDPLVDTATSGIVSVEDTGGIASNSIDVLTVFETLEHLYDPEIEELLKLARRVLTPNGSLLHSVPVIGGLVLPLKELNHYRVLRCRDYSWAELARATLGGTVPRAVDIKSSHRGFDFRQLHSRLARSLHLQRQWCSPFPALPWYLNSQVFTVWTLPPSNRRCP